MSDTKAPGLLHALHLDESQRISRADICARLTNAMDHARVSQRHVAVLLVALTRNDRLEAMLGVPPAAIMAEALGRMPSALRGTDRYAGLTEDKLCVILPNLKSTALAQLAANKIIQTLEAPYVIDGSVCSVRPVVGIACFPQHADLAEQLIVNADIAKRMARNRDLQLYVFQSEDRRDVDGYLGLGDALRDAIRTNQIEMHYQPQLRLDNGKCVAVEALLRWNSPEHGSISAPSIVRVAESSGSIGLLTEWVANTVIRHQMEWKAAGISLQTSFNLSAMSLTEVELPETIAQIVGTWNADPKNITLEITEGKSIADPEQSLAVMKRLKALGVRLSVDDFGTGYSSLSYIKQFPLDELKIDKMFVQQMRQSKADQAIVRSVIDLAKNFELNVVAEGVEDEATYKELKKLGCHLAQGFYISPALPSDQFIAWLQKRR